MNLAACVEFIHTATLLHDDVVDESLLRRGLASANAVFGNKASVLVGDFLFARAFQLMVEDGSLKVLRDSVARRRDHRRGRGAAARHAERPRDHRGAAISRWCSGKTAALFSAACEVGAVVAGAPGGGAAALRDYGMNLGIAFQLVDDALDYAADQATLGKTVGDDFREGKITLPVLSAYAAGDAAERDFWRRTIEASEQTEADLEHALRLMSERGAIRVTLQRAAQFAALARQSLAGFADTPLRRLLQAVANYAVSRAR